MKLSDFGYRFITGCIEVVAVTLATTAVGFGIVLYIFPIIGRLANGPPGWHLNSSTPWWGYGLILAALLLAVLSILVTAIVVMALVRTYFSRDNEESDIDDRHSPDPSRAVWTFTVLVLVVSTGVMGVGSAAYFDSPDADSCTAEIHYTNGTVEEIDIPDENNCQASVEVLLNSSSTDSTGDADRGSLRVSAIR